MVFPHNLGWGGCWQHFHQKMQKVSRAVPGSKEKSQPFHQEDVSTVGELECLEGDEWCVLQLFCRLA